MPISVPHDQVHRPRRAEHIVHGLPTSDGAGVKLMRVFSQQWQRRLDPFLMLDAFYTDDPADYAAGFPPHPHRGFETVTYMLAGRLRHRDSTGGEGLLQQGGVQWMTAGAGIVHSEMPEQEKGLMRGFQLWLNLSARDKFAKPGYRDVSADELRHLRTDQGAEIRLVAGRSHGVEGPVQKAVTEPLYADVQLQAGTVFEHALPPAHNAFAFVYEGELKIGEQTATTGQLVVLETNEAADGLRVEATKATRLLLVAGRPLGEPIVQYGPFVMNTREQIEQAIDDFNAGRMGRVAA